MTLACTGAAGVAFIGYGVVFLIWSFVGGGFELGVTTINGVTRAQLTTFEPAVLHYISHLHVATAVFIISTGLAVTALASYGVRRGELWAWTTAVAASVVGPALALPMHYLDLFSHDWVTIWGRSTLRRSAACPPRNTSSGASGDHLTNGHAVRSTALNRAHERRAGSPRTVRHLRGAHKNVHALATSSGPA